ncbi:hypothetical protein ACI2L1_44325 [Streptomyces sp. NPDC019531]|uniref:hypothetical protein n=1 Tax=Streptomyces sp. NPDC019531 TaxID=3365062 RepID=UPI00384A5861
MEELLVAVQVEGPAAVRDAAVEANAELHSHRVAAKSLLRSLRSEEATQEQLEQLQEVEGASWGAYIALVDAASRALDADGVSTLGRQRTGLLRSRKQGEA